MEDKIVKWMWRLAIGGLVFGFLVLLLVSTQQIPSFKDLENPTDNLASEIYASDASVLGRYYTENRVPVSYDELSPNLVNALIATEDERFYKHSGIDIRALFRVGVKTVLMGDSDSGGGSTITQQLAKNLYPRPNLSNMNSLFRFVILVKNKLKEWLTAIKLERSYTKEEIISMYFNEIEFLYQSYGIKAAAETYFGKTPKNLNLIESATLVGMLKNPYYLNPKIYPDASFQRRNVVLNQLRRNKFITREEYDSLKVEPTDISHFAASSHDVGPAPYFRAELKKVLKDILNSEEARKPDGSVYNLDKDGLKIYTTLNSRMQEHAENAVVNHMREKQKAFERHWSWGGTPWDYGTDRYYKKQKQISLDYLMMSTPRFESMKVAEFDKPTLDYQEKFDDVQFTPFTLDVLVRHNQGDPILDSLVSSRRITSDRSKYLKKVAKSDDFAPIQKAWVKLMDDSKKVFDKPVKMKVFDYGSPEFEKDTVMSPMDSIKYHRMILQTGVLAIEPGTGYVRSWVGGVNFKYFKQDHVTVDRQVGSTFKPFVYTAAITFQGVSPCQQVLDIPYTITREESSFGVPEDWAPKNAKGEYYNYEVTLYQALRESINSVTVFLMKQMGSVNPTIRIASSMGIPQEKIPRVPSICLGVADLSVMDMTKAYSCFANNGVLVNPVLITHIEDSNGRIIYKAVSEETQALNQEDNYVMVDMLKKAASGRAGVNRLKSENGGKTGTTQNQTDAWYMGITPNLVVGVWVGGEDRWIRFRNLTQGQGSVLARPIFAEMMKAIEDDPEIGLDVSKKFYMPSGIDRNLDCDLYEAERQATIVPYGSESGQPAEEEFFEG